MRPTPLLAVALLAAGCGTTKLSGTPHVPAGYKVFSAHGAAFAYPPSLAPAPESHGNVRFGTGDRWISFTFKPGSGVNFDGVKRSWRVAFTDVAGGKVSEQAVDVQDAQAGNLMTVTEPKNMEVRSLQVRRGRDAYVITAHAPKGDKAIDIDAVVRSFRLQTRT